jgi:transcriptional regulator with XRE-family HTH domain
LENVIFAKKTTGVMWKETLLVSANFYIPRFIVGKKLTVISYIVTKFNIMDRAKEKLIEMRKAKGFTQKDIADSLNMEVSGYSRRESGLTKIRIEEWVKLAKMLNVPVENIHEEDENQSITIKDNAVGDNCTNIFSITISETLLETLLKYNRKLEEENAELKLLMKK